MIQQCVLFWVLKMYHSYLCDSAENISSKPLTQVVSENVFGQSVCRVFFYFYYIENYLKTHVLHDEITNT